MGFYNMLVFTTWNR